MGTLIRAELINHSLPDLCHEEPECRTDFSSAVDALSPIFRVPADCSDGSFLIFCPTLHLMTEPAATIHLLQSLPYEKRHQSGDRGLKLLEIGKSYGFAPDFPS